MRHRLPHPSATFRLTRRRLFLHLLAFIGLLVLGGLACGVIGFVENPARLAGVSYWAAATSAPLATVTVFLGTTTPVYADTPVPGTVTVTPAPATTTPGLPIIGYTTPEPLQTPYYRVGAFYMNSDVYVGGLDGLVFRVTGHETQSSPNNEKAIYHFITIRVKNYTGEEIIVPASDVFFIRRVEQKGEMLAGRWVAQNEPLIARNLPVYETQQLEPIANDGERDFVLGFVVPDGEVHELGLITNWERPVEGGLPVWFYLENDPLGPFTDAYKPPPPTPIVLDDSDTLTGSGEPGSSNGMWPTTGLVTRGFGCHELYTGIDGTGFGCPPEEPWFHNGVDIANNLGTLIWSPVDGEMLYAGPNTAGPDCSHIAGSQPPHEGLGNYQRVQGSDTVHYLGHLSDFFVTSGSVTAGQTIAEMGSTGCSTGPHLHWTMYQAGNLIDPAAWAGPGPSP